MAKEKHSDLLGLYEAAMRYPTITGTAQFQQGTYTGNGVDGYEPLTLGFWPYNFKEKRDGAYYAFERMFNKGTKPCQYAGGTNSYTDVIIGATANSPVLGTSAYGNANGAVYVYQAFGTSGTPVAASQLKCKVLTWTGNGADDRAITGAGFQPQLVWIKNEGAYIGVWRSTYQVGDLTGAWYNLADYANAIQSLDADGFTVGSNTSVNANAVVHHAVCFKQDSAGTAQAAFGEMNVGQLSDRWFVPTPFIPKVICIWEETTGWVCLWLSTMGNDSTAYLGRNVANFVGGVENVPTSEPYGFWLGTDANVQAANYHTSWMALSEG